MTIVFLIVASGLFMRQALERRKSSEPHPENFGLETHLALLLRLRRKPHRQRRAQAIPQKNQAQRQVDQPTNPTSLATPKRKKEKEIKRTFELLALITFICILTIGCDEAPHLTTKGGEKLTILGGVFLVAFVLVLYLMGRFLSRIEREDGPDLGCGGALSLMSGILLGFLLLWGMYTAIVCTSKWIWDIVSTCF